MKRLVTLTPALALLLPLALAGCSGADAEPDAAQEPAPSAPAASPEATPSEAPSEAPAEWTVELLDGFPEDVVPLYKSDLIDTASYSVRNDPQYAAVEGLRNIHHAVYHSSVPPAEVLAFYLETMDTTTDADPSDGLVEGTVGDYTVWVNTTEESSYTAVYVSVDEPAERVTTTNPFYADYPADLVEVPDSFVFFEDKYYEYLYRSTDMAFWRQFDIADADDDGTADLTLEDVYAFYQERHGDKPEFTVLPDSRMITWKDGTYAVTLAFYEGGGRGVLEFGWDSEPEA